MATPGRVGRDVDARARPLCACGAQTQTGPQPRWPCSGRFRARRFGPISWPVHLSSAPGSHEGWQQAKRLACAEPQGLLAKSAAHFSVFGVPRMNISPILCLEDEHFFFMSRMNISPILGDYQKPAGCP